MLAVSYLRQWTAVRTADPRRHLCLALVRPLVLLPTEIDRGLEALWMLNHPDLLPDGEVLRIEAQRCPPLGDSLGRRSPLEQLGSQACPRLHQFALSRTQAVGWLIAGRLDRVGVAINQALDGVNVIRIRDAEAADFTVANDPGLIQQDAVGHDFVVEELRQPILTVDGCGKGRSGRRDPGPNRLGTG